MGCSVGKADIKNARVPAASVDPAEGKETVSNIEELKIRAGQFIQHLKEPFSSRYRIVKELGSGNFGRVYTVQQKSTREMRAVKEIDKRKAEQSGGSHQKFIAEVEILSKLDHPNILKIFEMYEDEKKFYVVSEICTGGELFDYITSRTSLSEQTTAIIMRQVLSAVTYCHSNHIVHRDIKPENLLLDTPPITPDQIHIKLIDFGTSCLCESNQILRQTLGTAYYIAPEVLEKSYDEKCDVWSCGVVLYVLLCGFPPFAGNNDEEILRKVRTGKYSFSQEIWRSVSSSAKNLVKKMLEIDPKRRISAMDCLSDAWLQSFSSESSKDAEATALSLMNLRSFNGTQKLRQAFLAFITSQLMTKEQGKQLAKTFRVLDKNGDGRLSREELMEAYSETMSIVQAEATVQHIMEQVDSDGNGFIDYSEFVLACSNQQTLLSKVNLEAAFAAFDRDRSGKISANELREMLGAANSTSDSVWDDLIRQADQNGDGEIEYQEFAKLMLSSV